MRHLERSLEAGVSGSPPRRGGAAAKHAAEPASATGSKRTLDETEIFHSTWQHRACVGGAVAVLAATFLQGCAKVHDPVTAAVAAAAVVAAYYVAGAHDNVARANAIAIDGALLSRMHCATLLAAPAQQR